MDNVKKSSLFKWKFLIVLTLGLFCSCIHEYPNDSPDNPSAAHVDIQLTIDLDWKYFIEEIGFSTKARNSANYQLIVEVTKDSELKGREEVFFSAEEFANGTLRHTLPFTLKPAAYSIAAWVNAVDDHGKNHFYETSSLSNVEQLSLPVKWDETMICGYAADILDLREYRGQTNVDVVKKMTVTHCGGRFELVATDINDFLGAQKNALLQGESYTMTLSFSPESPFGFNLFSGGVLRNGNLSERTGELSLPFGLYDELTIASGFIFCKADEDVELTLSVHNSARQLIVKTPPFRLPIKNGYVTRAKGNFLSNEFRNSIDINNIWEGEITIEL